MGLDLGIEQTGQFDFLACVEKERSFCDTIRHNQFEGRLSKKLRIYQNDIRDLDPQKVLEDCGLKPGQLDLLVGGPPCQSFSTAGKRGTTQDERGALLWQFLKFVEVLQPKFFVIENVRGLISAALIHRPIASRPNKGGKPFSEDEMPGSVVRQLAQRLKDCGGASYHMDCFEVNAVNYGAPQLRERVVFIGNRFGQQVDFPEPTHGKLPGQKPWRTLRDAIGKLRDPGPVVMDFSPRKKRYLAMIPPGSNWRSLPVAKQKESMGRAWLAKGGRSGWWRRLSFDLPCPTLVTMPNHASTALCHPLHVRALSLKEYAAIQEFPSDWQFVGTPAQQYAQAGNAVPVRLGEVIGQTMATALNAAKERSWRALKAEVDDFRIVYLQSHIRTRQWFKEGVTKVWEDESDTSARPMYAASVTKRRERAMAAR